MSAEDRGDRRIGGPGCEMCDWVGVMDGLEPCPGCDPVGVVVAEIHNWHWAQGRGGQFCAFDAEEWPCSIYRAAESLSVADVKPHTLVARLAAEAEAAESVEDDGLPLPEGTKVTRGLIRMRTTFDAEASATYVYLTDRPVARTASLSDSVNVDLDAEGTPCGVEVLGVRAREVPTSAQPLRLMFRGWQGRA